MIDIAKLKIGMKVKCHDKVFKGSSGYEHFIQLFPDGIAPIQLIVKDGVDVGGFEPFENQFFFYFEEIELLPNTQLNLFKEDL
uniref:Uncharacterized protein n=1 Tax=viral metagenome TaxID=1070528 RepID=A0A6M3LG34_9ZZZZ